MAHERPARRTPPPPASSLPPSWAKDFTEQFRQRLSTRRMTQLASSRCSSLRATSPPPRTSSIHYPRDLHRHPQLPSRHGDGTRHAASLDPLDDFALGAPPPPSSQSLRNLPIMASPPVDHASRQFRSHLLIFAETPMKWENPGLLDEAMSSVPLDRIYQQADEEVQLLAATAESVGRKPAWTYQDCVIRALLRWFRESFFTWVNNPPCSICGAGTFAKGMCAPTPDERALGGNRVELYQCSMADCGSYERFPRYNDAFVLMQTKRGRCGEWANCFSMLCRAMGSRVRWVWNSEDRVWTEVYSEYRKRWVHVDCCEGQFDKPLLYTEGWGKKMAYCIAFSADGATDVTRRYCRNPAKYGLERNRVTEAALLHITDEIKRIRRKDMPKEEKFRLEGEDMREDRELRHYYVSSITAEVAKLMPPRAPRLDANALKALEGRQSATNEWVREQGEDARTGPRSRHDQQ